MQPTTDSVLFDTYFCVGHWQAIFALGKRGELRRQPFQQPPLSQETAAHATDFRFMRICCAAGRPLTERTPRSNPLALAFLIVNSI